VNRFDQGGFPLVANPEPYTVEGELSLALEVDADGNPNWRNMWLNELAKLQHVTAAQEKNGADQEWYRIMVTRVRGAFMPPDPHTMGMDGVEAAAGGSGQVADE
jgi:forkhead box protein J2/3